VLVQRRADSGHGLGVEGEIGAEAADHGADARGELADGELGAQGRLSGG
jgi:hypothetical protein